MHAYFSRTEFITRNLPSITTIQNIDNRRRIFVTLLNPERTTCLAILIHGVIFANEIGVFVSILETQFRLGYEIRLCVLIIILTVYVVSAKKCH